MQPFYVYSPINGRIGDYYNFNKCNLKPKPEIPTPNPDGTPCCIKEVIAPEIVWEEWAIFAPYIGVGITGFDEEVATWCASEAGMAFARESRCLQRSVWVRLKPDLNVYDLNIPDLEDVGGLLAVFDGDKRYETGSYNLRYEDAGVIRDNVFYANDWLIQTTKNIELIIYAVPKQGFMHFDRYLFDKYQNYITRHAKYLYMSKLHIADPLFQVVAAQDRFNLACRKVASESTAWLTELRNSSSSYAVTPSKGWLW